MTTNNNLRAFKILYIILFIFILFTTGPFSGRFFDQGKFHGYFAVIALIIGIFFGYGEMIIESFRFRKQWKPIFTMLIVGMIFVIIKGVQKDFSLLLTINTVELKASLVEEFVFRSLMLGMMLKIDKIEFRKDHITFLNLKTPYIWNSKQSNKLIRVVVLSSIYFSLFHIWDLTFLPPLGKLINFTSRIILGIIYGGFYVLSGKKIYPSFFLHYINNLYA